ncbi:MAG: 1-deoxy-D-xylulose-5-phosphate synthase [Calditrichia bacterium]
MEILQSINSPEDLKTLNREELGKLSEEIRHYLVEVIPAVGGHFASSLGVVELTIALHYIFNTPEDQLVWDVGHQAYAHKVITGRRDELKSIRQYSGISGFPKRSESVYDTFGVGHASTSISAALGLAAARDLQGKKNKVVAIIGDGSLTGGLAFEGLNNAGQSGRNLLVVLNDNNMSISPNVGAISNYLNLIITNPFYEKVKAEVWDFTARIPPLTDKIRSLVRRTQDSIKTFILPGLFFEDLGFRYFGPINGHSLDELLQILGRIKDLPGPILLHVLTKKGKGFAEAEEHPEQYHGISANHVNGAANPSEKKTYSYMDIFGKTMIQLAEKNEKLCAITAAMGEGTGLHNFQHKFAERFFDVGIAEGHAVTFAAGLAAAGSRPVVAIYSTFMQRAFDQMIHDVALQKLPVIFAMDRAGIVGEDGPTHHGAFDISYANSIPDLIISAPKNGLELRNLLYTAQVQSEFPFVIRYPRSKAPDFIDFQEKFKEIPIGSWEIVHTGKKLLVLSVGTMVEESLRTLEILQKSGLNPTVINCRFVKPFDEKMLHDLLRTHKQIYTIEENSREGGFGQKIAAFLHEHGYGDHVHLKIKGIPDQFLTHGAREVMLEKAGLSAGKIAEWILTDNGLEGDVSSLSEKYEEESKPIL